MTLRIIREKHSSQSTSLNGDELALFTAGSSILPSVQDEEKLYCP